MGLAQSEGWDWAEPEVLGLSMHAIVRSTSETHNVGIAAGSMSGYMYYNNSYVSGAVISRHSTGVFDYVDQSGQINMAADVLVDGWSKVGFIGWGNNVGVLFNIKINITV